MEREHTIEALLAELEGRTTDLDYFSTSSRIEACRKQYKDAPDLAGAFAAAAEEKAFSLTEDSGEAGGYQSYFGPQMTGTRTDGVVVQWPDVGALDVKTIDYWAERADATGNPFLRARYADLVWDLSRTVAGKPAPLRFAHAAIDASVEAVQRDMFEWSLSSMTRLRRALDLSLSIGDDARAKLVVGAIIAFDDKIAAKQGRGFAFDVLTGSRKIPLSPDQRRKILDDMEGYLAQLVAGTDIDPALTQSAIERLLSHYRSAQSAENQKRVLRLYKAAIEKFAGAASPLVASTWLDKVHKALVSDGLHEEAEAMAPLMRDVNRAALGDMKEFSSTVRIPRADLDSAIAQMLEGDLDTVLGRFVGAFLPDRTALEQQVKDIAKQSPFLSMISISVRAHDGRPVGSIGSVEDDLNGRVLREMDARMQAMAPLLRLTAERIWAQFEISPERVMTFVARSPAFDAQRYPTISKGLAAYFAADYVAALCILIPEIEAAVRQLARLTGASIEKRSRLGGLDLKSLGLLLSEQHVKQVLTERVTFYMRVLLTDGRGWNLRNGVCHGFLPPSSMGNVAADRVVHTLILLGSLRAGDAKGDTDVTPAATPAESET